MLLARSWWLRTATGARRLSGVVIVLQGFRGRADTVNMKVAYHCGSTLS